MDIFTSQVKRKGEKSGKRGFTLIETFVAITVLLTALAGPLTIASKGLSSAILARDQITAFYLAQDAIEYIRQKRDTNLLGGNTWLTNLSSCVSALCRVDSKEDQITACGGTCPPLRYDDADGFFTYDLSDPTTAFTRTVTIIPVVAHEVTLKVTVAWRTGIFERQFTARENLFDWQ